MIESVSDALDALREAVEQFPDAVPTGPWVRPECPPASDGTDREAASDELRWAELDQQLDGHVAGRRVLVVGGGASDDATAFAARGAGVVLAREHSDQLDPEVDGVFDIVHCNGLLHRVSDPATLLRRLRSSTAPGGTLLLGSMLLADPERSEYLRFIPDQQAGERTWWFVPGRLAVRWLLQATGFEVVAEFAEQEGPRDRFPVITGYLRAVPRDP